ncbi:MAG: hypothetical protein L3J67_04205 [Hyphomicrobiaceae bacterium]|nr:hypothetical protein [Hyphomicrobiaceae bacterium]
MDAIEELKMVVSQYVKKGDERGVDYFIGYDWFKLNEDEEGVFELNAIEMNLLTAVYDAYEGVLGVFHNDIHAKKERCAAVREVLPWMDPNMHSDLQFRKFADIFDVAPDKAACIYYKMLFWQYRNDIATFLVPE